MKTLFLSLAVLCLGFQTQAQPMNTKLPADSLTWKIHRSGELKYLIHLPTEYSAKQKGRRWPLMLFLHGAGERGSDVQRASIHGPMSLVKQGTNFPFIIIAPVCPEGQVWENEPLLQLLDRIEKKYAVDTNRVYLTGLSMGGYGTWKLGLARPERFAALVPICGGGNMIDVILGTRDKGDALKNLPIWAFHGAKDDVVPLEESERMVTQLKKLGVKDVKLTVYPEAQHNSWAETYNNPKLYEWLLEQRRK
jgi:predicted peptidase